MKFTSDDLAKELKSRNIRLSHQRLKVLEYLSENHCHPTVDQIYTSLHKEIPTLSKTTVYSTLGALADAGMVKPINIEGNEIRYDITVEDHGHFKCESCGTIYDFPADLSCLESKALHGFQIKEKNVYFKGTCPMCLANKN